MPRMYTISFFEQAITAANADYDLFQLDSAADKPIRIAQIDVFNKSEIGDAQEEMVSMTIVRGNTTVGSGGASATPRPINFADAAAGFTARTADSVISTAGTAVTLYSGGFNIRAGWSIIWPETLRPSTVDGAGFLCVRMATALADDAIFSGTMWVEEMP
jgi:hypothetical protein